MLKTQGLDQTLPSIIHPSSTQAMWDIIYSTLFSLMQGKKSSIHSTIPLTQLKNVLIVLILSASKVQHVPPGASGSRKFS